MLTSLTCVYSEDDPCNVQVVVRSGATEDGDQLAATCGTELPEELSVSGLSEVRVDFLNNGEDKEKVFSGFALQYIVETAGTATGQLGALDTSTPLHHSHATMLCCAALCLLLFPTDERVDCVPGPWSEWGQCSATCGGGQHARTRGVEVPAQNGGTECTDMSQTEDCNQQPCTSGVCVCAMATLWQLGAHVAHPTTAPCCARAHSRLRC